MYIIKLPKVVLVQYFRLYFRQYLLIRVHYFSDKSDTSSIRSKSARAMRQSSSPIPTSKQRMAKAKNLIIPPFTSAGRRMRRKSGEEGPIQIKVGSNESTKSIEQSEFSPKVNILFAIQQFIVKSMILLSDLVGFKKLYIS